MSGQQNNLFQIAIDKREKIPWLFDAIPQRRARGRRSAFNADTVPCTLRSGDYSIVGFQDRIAVERKSIPDCVQSITKHRRRFVNALSRLQEMERACVVVEGNWHDIMKYAKEHTRATTQSINGSFIAWIHRFPAVHWLMRPSRRYAMLTCYRYLERFYLDQENSRD